MKRVGGGFSLVALESLLPGTGFAEVGQSTSLEKMSTLDKRMSKIPELTLTLIENEFTRYGVDEYKKKASRKFIPSEQYSHGLDRLIEKEIAQYESYGTRRSWKGNQVFIRDTRFFYGGRQQTATQVIYLTQDAIGNPDEKYDLQVRQYRSESSIRGYDPKLLEVLSTTLKASLDDILQNVKRESVSEDGAKGRIRERILTTGDAYNAEAGGKLWRINQKPIEVITYKEFWFTSITDALSAEIEQDLQDQREKFYLKEGLPSGSYGGTLLSKRTIGDYIEYTSIERRPSREDRIRMLQERAKEKKEGKKEPLSVERDAFAFWDKKGYFNIRIYDGENTVSPGNNTNNMQNLPDYKFRSYFEYVASFNGRIMVLIPQLTGHHGRTPLDENREGQRYFSPCTGQGRGAVKKGVDSYDSRVFAAEREFRGLYNQLAAKNNLPTKIN